MTNFIDMHDYNYTNLSLEEGDVGTKTLKMWWAGADGFSHNTISLMVHVQTISWTMQAC